nr:unnamed protein product [Haemonchus contortus]
MTSEVVLVSCYIESSMMGKQACSPVPEPKVKGKGHDVVYVTLVTNQTYNPAGINTFLSDFSKTEIQQYSASVGNFSNLNCTNTDGYFTWTFKLTDANCSIVNAWVKQIVASSSFYKAGYTSCGSETFTAYVTLVTYTSWQPALKSQELSLFNVTNARPYSASLGNFTDLHVFNVNGFLAYAFTFTNANCSNVEHWVRLTVAGNSEIKAFANGEVDKLATMGGASARGGALAGGFQWSPADIAYNGYLSDISQTEAEGHLAYTFTYTNANCSNVEHSVALLVDGASAGEDFVNGTVTCVHAGNRTPWVVSPPPWATTTTNDNLIEITSPPTTTTTATPLVIYPGGALPAAPVFIPYQSDYEETAEHVEESVSSFESMSIMGL